MQLSCFSYELPPALIASEPCATRTGSRLLCLDGSTGNTQHQSFMALLDRVEPGDVLVFNDTRVLPARLFGRKPTGGHVEVLVERLLPKNRCLAHVRASRAPTVGSTILLGEDEPVLNVQVVGREGNLFVLDFPAGTDVPHWMTQHGHMPLPPYIDRADQLSDQERYQTVYANQPGAVAAPTAGLHFDQVLLDALKAKGANLQFVTLHVGAGTFQPVRCDDIREHAMHQEWLSVSPAVCEAIAAARVANKRVIAVGTTSVRALESAARDGTLQAYSGDTNIFIYPGYRFRVVDALVTNFHLPESTLLMLVSAFAGYRHVMAAYHEAIREQYRFFSYGDAMWITRNPHAHEEIPA